MGRLCEVGRCARWDAERFDACGTYYVCPGHREQIDRLTTQHQQEEWS
jgi:hypothetical protein